ncbi:MAG: UDP-glucose dehydrogenase family protein [Candidatus Binatia bacterium]
MKVSIFGAGYVGLVTGACLADIGHSVVCVDVDPEKVDTINKGVAPIHEIHLEKMLRRNVPVRLRATTDTREAVLASDLSLIAVGTPSDGERIDLTQIKTVASQIGQSLRQKNTYHLVAVKSTVVPGTTDEVVRPILEAASQKNAGVDFGLGMNPEFLTEGQAVEDFMTPDRIVLGGIDAKSLDLLEELYEPFPRAVRLRTNNKTAEMIKYTSNALLATMISFSNEIANLCSAVGGIDSVDVMRAVHLNRYLSVSLPDGKSLMASIASFLIPGCGFGGSCLPKDVKALRAYGEQTGVSMRLLDAVLRINEGQPHKIVSLLKKYFVSLQGVRIAILGLAFRPDTNDMRESPAIPIIDQLLADGADIQAYDPIANNEARKLFRGRPIRLRDDLQSAISGVEAIVLVTSWNEFKKVPELLGRMNPQPIFIDGRRLLDKHSMSRYDGIGL